MTPAYWKKVIKDTIIVFKDELLQPLIHRIEILENDVRDKAKELENHQKELANEDTVIEILNENNKSLEDWVRSDEDYVDKVTKWARTKRTS